MQEWGGIIGGVQKKKEEEWCSHRGQKRRFQKDQREGKVTENGLMGGKKSPSTGEGPLFGRGAGEGGKKTKGRGPEAMGGKIWDGGKKE